MGTEEKSRTVCRDSVNGRFITGAQRRVGQHDIQLVNSQLAERGPRLPLVAGEADLLVGFERGLSSR